MQKNDPEIIKEYLKSTVIDIEVTDFYKEQNISANFTGRKGVIAFKAHYPSEDEEFDIFEMLENNTIPLTVDIKNENEIEYPIKCTIENFKKFAVLDLVVLCQLEENIDEGQYSIAFNNTLDNFSVIVNVNSKTFYFSKLDEDIPCLFSDAQNLIVQENQETLQFKFKIFSYQNEKLFLYDESKSGVISLENCIQSDDNLVCTFSKDKLLEIMSSSPETFILHYIDNNYRENKFNLVGLINIIYSNIEKEDIYVGIIKPVETEISIQKVFAYETNITNISKIENGLNSFSMDFEYIGKLMCGFRKYENNPLLLICNDPNYYYAKLQDIEEEIILNDINIKYNFRIQPFNFIDAIFFYCTDTFSANLAYPQILDFNSQDSITITFYGYISNEEGFRLNKAASDLNCELLGGNHILSCIVPKSHFKGRKSGYYNLIHLDFYDGYEEVNNFYDIPPFKVMINESQIDEIIVEDLYGEGESHRGIIGKKGILALKTDIFDEINFFNKLDIENQTNFETFISNSLENYKVNCNLVKFTDEPILVFCELDETIPEGNYLIDFNNTITYNNEEIYLSSKSSFDFQKLNKDMPVLYADIQNIDVEENNDFIEMKFKIISYNGEKLYLLFNKDDRSLSINYLDNCNRYSNELICLFKKDFLQQIMAARKNAFQIAYIDNNYDTNIFDLVKNIYINHYEIQKEDLYIEITKPLQREKSLYSYIAYETNITNISNLLIGLDSFPMSFNNGIGYCTFRKYEENPLLLICIPFVEELEDNFTYLEDFENEIILNDINIKYNFRIQPFINTTFIYINQDDRQFFCIYSYPQILNFTNQDSLTITYLGSFMNSDMQIDQAIRFTEADYLKCQIKGESFILECIVPKSHFEGKKSGYYYTIYENDYNLKLTWYQIPPVQVILKEPDIETDIIIVEEVHEDFEEIGRQGALVLTTDFWDEDNNIFNNLDIENKTNFKTFIFDSIKSYEVDCRLVKLTKEPILVFCELDDKIPEGNYSIAFNNTIIYNNVLIIIDSRESFDFTKLDIDKPSLYSDCQNITVEENKESIEMKFKILSYNNEKIFISNYNRHFENLDNCFRKDNELICYLKKDKLLEIMTQEEEHFDYLFGIDTSTSRITDFPLVEEIVINYVGIIKEDVFVGITNSLENNLDVIKGITYETNVTNISNVLMGLEGFEMTFENSEFTICFFKKYDDSPLLLICLPEESINETRLSDINDEIILNNINIRYNFRIQPVKKSEVIYIKESFTFFPLINYPKILDFNYQDELTITLAGLILFDLGIKLNSDADNLKCEMIEIGISICNISKLHFKGKKSGYYYLIHETDSNEILTFYEIPPFKVILNEEEPEEEEEQPIPEPEEEEEQIEPEEEEKEQPEPEEEEEKPIEPEEEEKEQPEPEEEEEYQPEPEEKEEEQEESKEEEKKDHDESEEEDHRKEEESKDDEKSEEEKEEEEEGDNDDNNGGGGGKSSNTTTTLIIVFSVIGGILILVGIFFLYHFLRKRNTVNSVEQGVSNRELLESQELKD